MIIISKNSSETEEIGKMLAQEFKKNSEKKSQGALVVALEGNLGSGKTTFTKGFAKGLKIRKKITSPTFIILKEYKAQNFYHIDCYRLQKPKEILDLGFKEIISNPENIVIIEWAEKIKKVLPKEKITVKFGFVDEETRKLTIK